MNSPQIATPQEADKFFAKDAKKLAQNPSPQIVKRTIDGVKNDLHDIKKTAPIAERFALLRRIGRLLKIPAYRGLLAFTIYMNYIDFQKLVVDRQNVERKKFNTYAWGVFGFNSVEKTHQSLMALEVQMMVISILQMLSVASASSVFYRLIKSFLEKKNTNKDKKNTNKKSSFRSPGETGPH
jgi:hypothetical protein